MNTKVELERVAFSPGEFAELFGKSQTWGYRQIYAGKVKAITEHGRILIPAAEVDAILQTAGVYDGMKPKPIKTKETIKALAPHLGNAWQNFLSVRRQAKQPTTQQASTASARWPSAPSQRQAAMARLSKNDR